MAAGDLTTVAAAEAWGSIKSSVSADAEVQALISAASAWISSYCERNFSGVVAYSEIRRGNGNRELFLADAPVVSITSLTIDTQVIPAQPADGQPG